MMRIKLVTIFTTGIAALDLTGCEQTEQVATVDEARQSVDQVFQEVRQQTVVLLQRTSKYLFGVSLQQGSENPVEETTPADLPI